MKKALLKLMFFGAAAGVSVVVFSPRARGSDAAITPVTATLPGADITDLYVFPSPANSNNVVLVMDVHPFIPSGNGGQTVFDPNVLFQFKIDNTGDNVEDLVIQAKFTGTGPFQIVQIAGPVKPSSTGTQSVFESADPTAGTINQAFTLTNGIRVFCGAREDPFFFDLARFWQILPDRQTPVNGVAIPSGTANALQKTSFRGFPQTEAGAGPPTDFFAGLNVMSIVLEVPKSMLVGSGNGQINVWCTTSR